MAFRDHDFLQRGSSALSKVRAGWPSAAKRLLDRLATSRFAIGLCAVLQLVSCASVPTDPEERADFERTNDPAEPTNRAIFAGNKFLDDHTIKPVARAYQDNVPDGVRHGLHNFVSNLEHPAIFVNDMLQGNLSRAWNTTERLVVNTTVGGAGLFDVASDWDLPRHSADFGQTFGVWGMGPGPAVQIPLLGPSNARDAVGKIAGIVADPFSFVTSGAVTAARKAAGGVGIIDGRAQNLKMTDELEQNSLDYYAKLRSIVAQRRAKFVAEGKAGRVNSSAGGDTSDPWDGGS